MLANSEWSKFWNANRFKMHVACVAGDKREVKKKRKKKKSAKAKRKKEKRSEGF